MNALVQVAHIKYRGHLQDVLAANDKGAQGVRGKLNTEIDINAIVPGMPPRTTEKKAAFKCVEGESLIVSISRRCRSTEYISENGPGNWLCDRTVISKMRPWKHNACAHLCLESQ